MQTTYRRPPKIASLALSVAGALGLSPSADAGFLTLATEPLGTATTSIKPNVMFILDDSGSMFREFMPDGVGAPSPWFSGYGACFDSGDTGHLPNSSLATPTVTTETSGAISADLANLDRCKPGDPPYMSSDVNTIYYNPSIYYRPGVNYDGTEKPSQNALNTADWTKVRTDEYNVENWGQLADADFDSNLTSTEKSNANADEVDIATGYPDRVWCTTTSEASTNPLGGNCRVNSAYLYPNFQFKHGTTNGSAPAFISTAPYYYRAQTTQYCRPDGTDCQSGTDIDPAVHTLQQAEYCLDSELTNCAVGTAVTSKHVFSGIRWCNNSNLREDPVTNNPRTNYCQRKNIGTFIYPKHLGRVKTQTGSFPAVSNEGQITVTSVSASGGTINSITIGGVAVISGSFAVPSGTSVSGTAALLASAINAHISAPEYAASAVGANVIITQAVPGQSGAGAAIVVNTNLVQTQAPRVTLTLASVSANTVRTISSLTVGGTQLLCTNTAGSLSFGGGGAVVANNSLSIAASSGWNQTSERSAVMVAIIDRINSCGTGYSAGSFAHITGGTNITITAPLGTADGGAVAISGTSVSGFGAGTLAGSVGGPSIATSVTTMAGGADIFSGTRSVRVGVGKFARTDIIPSVTSYVRASTRIDCLGSTCTYDEEMTNFANWYTYYRSRMKMMKTAAGRAFVSVDNTYRVGFITINPGSTVSSTKYLKVAEFTGGATGHKQAWYAKFYGQSAGNFTPLREALSRVGWMYSGKFNAGLTAGIATADDPMTASCQPNFAILSTDGYWNKEAGQKPDTTAIGNQDSTNAGYSTRTSGAYDGAVLSSTSAGDGTAGGSDTLADVAMYYYKNDLRTSGSFATNNVPVTNKDTNNTQHMVTFTVGLGLDGELTYRSDYETASSGDFADIKSGLKNWPSPKGDSPSALDDLWHAAVNGRGVFFSARDPEQLSNALIDTLAGLQTRIGAGAAAATSNLQPVAGDNFAFTAQYQTSDWIGDLKARTIDLSSGIVSAVTLWSAASLLDLAAHTERKLFTYDPLDTTGNLMKHLCWDAAVHANCTDGSGLTATEKGYFAASGLTQYALFDLAKKATADAGAGDKVLNFFRGERTYEDSGGGAPTDLFRLRDSILGDIVNAQPSYVKKSPFSYADAGYAAFQTNTLTRKGTVFAASNDGFLHAFETDALNTPYYQTAGIGTDITSDDTFSCAGLPAVSSCNVGNGVEKWAYVPGLVLPNVRQLANKPYNHRYYTDGSPSVGDICLSTDCGSSGSATASDWRTIIVAGLNSGGMGYYALDVTDPDPNRIKVLWEFTNKSVCYTDTEIAVGDKTSDCHVGLSYGNPLITKRRSDGKWVVIVTSGYNNNVGGGDGKGYLYVLEAHTGKILSRVSTGVGSAASPSGLAKINGWATNANIDNTVLGVYGGDLEGNLWRFDVQTSSPTVVKVATVVSAGGTAQPITVKPELGPVPNQPNDRLILFGTGKFLESSDKTDLSDQTIYALKDVPATATGPIIANVRGTSVKVREFDSYTVDDPTRTVQSGTAPTWSTDFGWLIDLPDDGERVNVDPQLQLGTLVVASNVPSGDTCTAGGFSWLNFLDYATGSYIPGATGDMASTKFASSLAVGINVIMLPGGKVVTIVTTADNQQLTQNTPVPSSSFAGRRVSWRELVRE